MNQHQYAARCSQRPTNKLIQLHRLESRNLVKILFCADLFSNSCLLKSHQDARGHFISRAWRRSKPRSGTNTWPLHAGRIDGPTLGLPLTFQLQPRADPSVPCTTTANPEWNPLGLTRPGGTLSPTSRALLWGLRAPAAPAGLCFAEHGLPCLARPWGHRRDSDTDLPLPSGLLVWGGGRWGGKSQGQRK